MQADVTPTLLKHLADQPVARTGDTPHDWSLAALDSVSMVEFIVFIETTFCIEIEQHEIRPENFDTVGAVVRFIEAKLTVARGSASSA